MKLSLEQQQRERRHEMEEAGESHHPKWFSKSSDENGKEKWTFKSEYWQLRENKDLRQVQVTPLW